MYHNKTLHKAMAKVVTAKNMRRLKWCSVMAGLASLIVMYFFKEHHMVSAAVSAATYEGSKLAQEFLEPLIRSFENMTEAAEEVAELAEEAVETLAA